MFAGAARQTVSSNPEVIDRIQKDYIPVALKAGDVARGGSGVEGKLYQELKRTMPQPQGIGTLNSAGRVLSWSLMFESQAQVIGFLDHVGERYRETPDHSKPVPAERFMRFPNQKLPTLEDPGTTFDIPHEHAAGEKCPGEPRRVKGALLTKVIGRALEDKGDPRSDARIQDNYIEDQFEITPTMLRALAAAQNAAKNKPFPLPDVLSRTIVSNAYLGILDVKPLEPVQSGAEEVMNDIHLWAEPSSENGLRVWGHSKVHGKRERNNNGKGPRWEHEIVLQWQGHLNPKAGAVALITEGQEQLHYDNSRTDTEEEAVAFLPAGRPLDFDGKVRYGMRAGF
ncbi:MAG: hypothetical protein ABF370_06600 [Verrucomicrobiales bacterium]